VEAQVFSLCAFPDQAAIVAGNMNGGIHWIDRDSPEQTRNIQHHRRGTYALLPIGNELFSGGGDGTVTRWDALKRRSSESLQISHASLRTIVYSKERNELAIGASDQSIYLLDAGTLSLKQVLKNAHQNSVFSLAYLPQSPYLISGGRDAMLRVWDLSREGIMVSEQPAHWYTVNDIAVSPEGSLFATASRDKTVKIWDSSNFELLKVLDTLRLGSHARSVNRLLWLPESLISCGDDGLAMGWRVHH
jgi:WD40 repeat protein